MTCPKRNNLIIHRDVNLIRRTTLFIGDIFPLECLFFSGNSIHLLKTIPRLVNVSYIEIRLALNHEHKSRATFDALAASGVNAQLE